MLQNQTDETMTVDVAIDTVNLEMAADGGSGQRVTVPANDRVAVRFPAMTQNVGTAYTQIVAASGKYGDAAQVAIPVYTPATTEAFAVYGTVDDGAVARARIAQPQGVFPQFGGLEVSTSATALQSLTDAVLYLQRYPFECTEQIASRVMVASLRDVLTALPAEGLQSPQEINAAMVRDIKLLEDLQNLDGGWPISAHGDETAVYNSIFVAHALQWAREQGLCGQARDHGCGAQFPLQRRSVLTVVQPHGEADADRVCAVRAVADGRL